MTVDVLGDAIRELPETFELRLQDPFGVTLARTKAVVTISEPVLGPFHAAATGNDLANTYVLGVLSHYVYEDNATTGTSFGSFQDAFRARFDHPEAGVTVTGLIDDSVTQFLLHSSERIILNASVTFSAVAPPPTSRKLAGSPP